MSPGNGQQLALIPKNDCSDLQLVRRETEDAGPVFDLRLRAIHPHLKPVVVGACTGDLQTWRRIVAALVDALRNERTVGATAEDEKPWAPTLNGK